MFVQFALLAAQMALGIATQKRPKKFTFEEFLEENKGDETRPIPYIRGKWKTTPQRIWLSDYSVRAVERDSQWSDYLVLGLAAVFLDTITVAYRYYVGQAFPLTWGPINRVHQIYVDDLACAVTPSTDNAGGSILIDHPQAFGGDQPPGEGGVYAICDVLPGTYSQPANPYLTSIEGNVQALRGIAALIVRGREGFEESGYFAAAGLGGSPKLRNWQVELMAWPDNLGTGLARLPDDSYNRAEVLYEWITKADYGAEYPIDNIDLTSFQVAAQTIYDEGNGFSGEINTGGNVGEIIDEIKASIDAELFEHPRDGLTLKLIRKDYSIPSLTTLNETNLDEVEEYTPGDYADSFNKTILNFTNANNNYQPRPAIYEDPANYHIQRRVATREVEYPGVTNAEQAQKLVTRDGRMLGQPWPPLVVNAGEAGRDLWPGDAYKFQWPNPLLEKIIRVSARTPSVSYEGNKSFRLVGTEDQYSTGLAAFGSPSETSHQNPAGNFSQAPPSAEWDEVGYPPDGLVKQSLPVNEDLTKVIVGGIIFGEHDAGQYARLYVTEPGGVQTLSPIFLSPDSDDKATFTWPALTDGTYTFCVETYSLTNVTNGEKVCASIIVTGASASPSISPSISPSPSRSVSPSASQSPSAGSSASPSVSPSASISPSSSVSSSGSGSASASVSPSSSVSPSPAGGEGNIVFLLSADVEPTGGGTPRWWDGVTGSAPTTSTTPTGVHTRAWNASAGGSVQLNLSVSTLSPAVWFRFYRTSDTTGAMIRLQGSSTEVHITLSYVAGGNFKVLSGATQLAISTGGHIALNTQYFIELTAVIANSTNGSFMCNLYNDSGTLLETISASGVDTREGTSEVSAVVLETIGYWEDAGFDSEGEIYGPSQVEITAPNGAGDLTQLSRAGTDTGANWSQVNEIPAASTGARVTSTGADQYDSYSFPNRGVAGTPIAAGVQAACSGFGLQFNYICRISGVTYEHSTVFTATSINKMYGGYWRNNPSTGLEWTDAEINATQFGIRWRSSSGITPSLYRSVLVQL